jgi:hypothetical protein
MARMIAYSLHHRSLYHHHQYAYWSIRGLEGVPAVLGAYELPENTRLLLVSKTKYLKALERETFLDLKGMSGMVYHVEANIKGKNLDFMEGPVVSYIDGREIVLGTGMDDYFSSAWWMTQSEQRYSLPGSMGVVDRGTDYLVAYRLHEDDPVVFSDSIKFEWQNGAAFANGKAIGNPATLRATFDFWVYVWDEAANPTATDAADLV